MRKFLRPYDQYNNEVTARAQQLVTTDRMTTEPVQPVKIKFCVDLEYLESVLTFGFIEGVDSYESLTDENSATT